MDAKYRLFKRGQIVVDLARTRSRPFDPGLAALALSLLPLLARRTNWNRRASPPAAGPR